MKKEAWAEHQSKLTPKKQPSDTQFKKDYHPPKLMPLKESPETGTSDNQPETQGGVWNDNS